jgi:hypothetical protein
MPTQIPSPQSRLILMVLLYFSFIHLYLFTYVVLLVETLQKLFEKQPASSEDPSFAKQTLAIATAIHNSLVLSKYAFLYKRKKQNDLLFSLLSWF